MIDMYYITEQPTTCPVCGVRTDLLADFYHTNLKMLVSECLNIKCKHVLLEIEPDQQ